MGTVQVTEIKQTKKGRYALFCDGEFLFSVDEETFAQHHITTGMKLTDQELESIRQNSDNQKAFRKALDFLALRDHSTAELKTKLQRTFDEETAQHAVDRVLDIGYLDDRAFAQKYADELIHRKGTSLRGAQNKLWQKGLSRDIIEEVLSAYEQDETAQIRELIEKKYRAKLAAGNTQAVFAALARRGFSASDIRAALNEYNAGIDEEY